MAEQLPAANKATTVTAFNKQDFQKVLNTVSAYGRPVIITTRAFAVANLVPEPEWRSDAAKEEMRQQGYLGKYAGADILVLEQTFEDASNTNPLVNEKIAYIIPAGANERPIKVSLEGAIKIRDVQREDWSTEMQIYRKLGVAVLAANAIGVYKIS